MFALQSNLLTVEVGLETENVELGGGVDDAGESGEKSKEGEHSEC